MFDVMMYDDVRFFNLLNRCEANNFWKYIDDNGIPRSCCTPRRHLKVPGIGIDGDLKICFSWWWECPKKRSTKKPVEGFWCQSSFFIVNRYYMPKNFKLFQGHCIRSIEIMMSIDYSFYPCISHSGWFLPQLEELNFLSKIHLEFVDIKWCF